MLRKEGGLESIQDSVNSSIQRLENYMKKRGERLITVTIKKYRQHKHKNNQQTKMGRKTSDKQLKYHKRKLGQAKKGNS